MKIKNQKGMTLIELIVVIVCIGILSGLALPKFFNISTQASEHSEADMVGALRTGLQLYYSQTMVDSGQGSFPNTLDDAEVGSSANTNPFFGNVLHDDYMGTKWSKVDNNTYIGPTGLTYIYDSDTGTFNESE